MLEFYNTIQLYWDNKYFVHGFQVVKISILFFFYFLF